MKPSPSFGGVRGGRTQRIINTTLLNYIQAIPPLGKVRGDQKKQFKIQQISLFLHIFKKS